jgi:hypothetical protein
MGITGMLRLAAMSTQTGRGAPARGEAQLNLSFGSIRSPAGWDNDDQSIAPVGAGNKSASLGLMGYCAHTRLSANGRL